ncbi:FAD synthase [Lecanosticta acicola]|uniref:FAD synthase n=1 Tax=Lecanosticta acicola TaxID=111012 RepID=A0AAI8Z2T7_9PEZI|nr:FAD synthase [Lecanosticta acicola]
MTTAHSHEEASATTPTAPSTVSNGPIREDVAPTQALPEQCARVHGKVYDLLKREPRTERIREVQRQTRISLRVLGDALQRYTLDEISFSYNGGKDCLVLLILYLAALHTHSQGQQPPPLIEDANTSDRANDHEVSHANADTAHQKLFQLPPTLRSVYIVSPNPFPAVTSFVASSSQKYHLSLARYHKPMKEAFASYLHDYPTVKAIFVGTRRTDPHGASLTHFDPTTDDWPSFTRIHPVIDWHYADIWSFIREVGVEYCELYDMGYTSLGGTDDTHPNPALAVASAEGGEVKYRPAYELVQDGEERLGRDGLKKTASV